MTPLPPPPPETGALAVDRDIEKLAPKFRALVITVIGRMESLGHDPVVFEACRSDERAAYLFGFGRDYDDGRGIVTYAPTAAKTWHRYGLAVDIISRASEWDAPDVFWNDLRAIAKYVGLVAGADFSHPDRPHVQFTSREMLVTPTDHDWALLQSAGVGAVWTELLAA